jgi:predicted Rossmann-fold nucleotide-binding protein
MNIAGFYDRLVEFLRHAAAEQFIRPEHRDLLIVESTAAGLVERLRERVGQTERGADRLDRS